LAIKLENLRNIGISAHIDSGKTTLTERILYYTQRIRKIHEVRGNDGVGATMDSMELERERGITITSAATYCNWRSHHVNIIDTPGHVDFTIEVERALRVLDGAVLVLCAVAGVQSQSLTVDRQMRRYGVPRLAFINKCDRVGADPQRACAQMREILGIHPVLLQRQIGIEDGFEGVLDLITMEAVFFKGEAGEKVERGPIPDNMRAEAALAREEMLDEISMFSDELTEAMLEDRVDEDLLRKAIRQATVDNQLVPVLIGSAYKNKGVQPLMDAVVDYLPHPGEITQKAFDLDADEDEITLRADPDAPTVALAFKLEDGRYGQLSLLRIYQGSMRRDDSLINTRTGRKHRVGRLVRMHADSMEDITEASAGDIVAMFGIDCHSGDTFTDGSIHLSMSSMHVPEPVIALAVKAADTDSEDKLSKALRRFVKEDPTFRVDVDPESNETRIRGMGELHLEVYLERIRREYHASIQTSPPQVAYREAPTRETSFDVTHKKQTGGSGQYGKVCGRIVPTEEDAFEFEDRVRGGHIPKQFIPSIKRGFAQMIERGPLIGAPVVGVRIVLEDGASHSVDSSEMAFAEAARQAWRQTFIKCSPRILEPIMRVDVESPSSFAGAVMASLTQRRGNILGVQEQAGQARAEAEVPLGEMFGYATALRSMTEGKAEFTMEFARYLPVPDSIASELAEAAQKRKLAASKA